MFFISRSLSLSTADVDLAFYNVSFLTGVIALGFAVAFDLIVFSFTDAIPHIVHFPGFGKWI